MMPEVVTDDPVTLLTIGGAVKTMLKVDAEAE